MIWPVTMMSMFTADCAEYGAYVTGKRNEGITFSIQAFSIKLGGAISGSLSMLLLAGNWLQIRFIPFVR